MKKITVGLLTLFLFILCVTNTYRFLFETKFEGDIASRMVLVLGPRLGLGSPYKDLWEIIPPGYIFVLQLWSIAFGNSVYVFVFLHFLILIGCAGLLFLVLKKLFSSYAFFIVFLSTSLVFFSPGINTMYISSEILGAFFTLLALACLLYIKSSWRFFLATAFFFVAGQMKDPFLFGIFAVAPLFFWSFFTQTSFTQRKNLVLSTLLGGVIPFAILLLYLQFMGSLPGYMQVLDTKTQFRSGFSVVLYLENSWRTLVYVQSLFQRWVIPLDVLILFFLLFVTVKFFKNTRVALKKHIVTISYDLRKVNLRPTEDFFMLFSIYLFIFGSFIGMYLQGSFSTHYLIQAVVPLYLFLGLVSRAFLRPIERWLKEKLRPIVAEALVACAMIAILIPKSYYAHSFVYVWQQRHVEKSLGLKETWQYLSGQSPTIDTAEVKAENAINQNLSPDECMIHVYGWHVARTYIYAKRKPCTRFFLINIVITQWQRDEYQKDILNSPPKAIVYGIGGGDFMVKEFEEKVINYSNILKNCYNADPQFTNFGNTFPATLYWAKYDKNTMKSCLAKANVIQQ